MILLAEAAPLIETVLPGSPEFARLVAVIILALIFDFINGFHDSANSIATIVSTRVLTPGKAVVMAAFFNFIAFLVFPLGVAATIGKGIIDPQIVDIHVITAALIGACGWNLITWHLGIPSSSSHALIGGLVGAALLKAGPSSLVWAGIGKTVLFIVIAPFLGLALGVAMAVAVAWIFRNFRPRRVKGIFRKGQLFSAAFFSLGHGGNDAQKTMGIIAMLLASHGYTYQGYQPVPDPGAWDALMNYFGSHFKNDFVPLWVVLSCHGAMGLGTLFGGWKIVKTMGRKLIKLRPVDGFCAEGAAAVTLVLTIIWKVPVSTTQTITGSIVGVGSVHRVTAVRWGVAGQILWAWILTIPGALIISAVSYWIVVNM